MIRDIITPTFGHTYRYSILSICLVIVACLSATAQTMTTELAKNQIFVGDQIDWKWTLTVSQNDVLLTPPAINDSVGKLHVIRKSSIDSAVNNGVKIYSQNITIAGFDSFGILMPELETLVWLSDKNDSSTVRSESGLELLVSTIDVDTSQSFMPIKEIILIENPSLFGRIVEHIGKYRIVYLIIGIVIIALILFLILRKVYNKRKNRQVIELPYEKAFRKMQELQTSDLWENHEYKKYYTELSNIIKDYIKEERGIDTSQLTSTELLKEFKKNRELRPLHKALRELLFTADLTKFAKGTPHEEYREEAIAHAQKIINTIEQDKIPQIPHA